MLLNVIILLLSFDEDEVTTRIFGRGATLSEHFRTSFRTAVRAH